MGSVISGITGAKENCVAFLRTHQHAAGSGNELDALQWTKGEQ
jgi:hypothetical protein